jgi:hypothetical protein
MKWGFVNSFPKFLSSSLVLLIITACNTNADAPKIVINAPPSGSDFREGQEIVVQSTASDPSGITRVELAVDATIVRTDPISIPQTTFTSSQTWIATPGRHVIIVRAYNKADVASDPAAIAVLVSPVPSTPTPVAAATPEPLAPTVAPTTAPIGCANDARFVADVTVPDGTSFSNGQTFDKTWRLRNAGTCAWDTAYRFVFVGGTAMTPSTVVNVPATAAGATVDIKVPMTAPSAPGAYTGAWQLRSPANTFFGPRVTVVINVPGSTSASPPTGCAIAYFTASPLTINAGDATTLSWGAVTGAQSVEIDQGIGGVGSPGSKVVNPPLTMTYTLIARCGSYNKTAQVTITVNPSSVSCSGTPNITFFSAANTSISLGSWTTLNWGAVTNADEVEIDPGIGGVATPGSASISPTATTTYTLTAYCKGKSATRQVTVQVQ